MFTDMENWAEIRRRVLVDGLSKRSACREFDIHWDTLQKILNHPEPPGLPPHRPEAQAQARPLPARHPPDPRGRQEGPEEAAAHRPADLRAAPRRARLHRRPDHRQGGRRRLEAPLAPRSSSRWPTRPARPRSTSARPRSPSTGRPTKVALFVMTLPYSDAIFVLRLPARVHRGVPRGPRPGLRLPRRRPPPDQLRQLQDRRGPDHRRPRPQGHRRVPPAQEPSPVRVPLLPGAAAQREGARRDAGRLRPPQLPRARSRPSTAAWSRSTPTSSGAAARTSPRRLWGKPATKAELLAEERAAFLPLPGEAFVAARVEPPVRRLAVAGPLRRQRLLGAHRVRPPPGHGRRHGRHRPRSSSATASWRRTAGAGAASGSPTTRCTTWPCWSASPGRWTSRRRWRAGSCRSASACCGGGWRPSSAAPGTRQFIKVLRLLERAEPRGS